jgi:hypothetical protein
MIEEEKKDLIAAFTILQEIDLEGDTNASNTWGNVSRNNQHKLRPSESSVHYQKYGTFCSRFSCQRLSPFYMPNIA